MRDPRHMPTRGDIIRCHIIGEVRVLSVINGRIRAFVVDSGQVLDFDHDDWRSYWAPFAGSFDEVLHAA